MAERTQRTMATQPQTRRAQHAKLSRKDALKKLASLIEESMAGQSEKEKDQRVKNFKERVERSTSASAKS